MHNLRQALLTKYLGPTLYLGPRIMVRAAAGREYHAYNSDLSEKDNHTFAAMSFASSRGWLDNNYFFGGILYSGDYVFVAIEKDKK